MREQPMVLSGKLTEQTLAHQLAVVTGAGGGIGFEAARALAWLGASVILAEISPSGRSAADRINGELGVSRAFYYRTDVGSERSVKNLAKQVTSRHGLVNIVLNNATVAPLGPVSRLPIEVWDASYRVNLRGPVLLARAFLPGMIAENAGVFACVTSEGLAHMGAYETLKTAQGHLSRTIDAELEVTEVISFTIGPGMVLTPTAVRGLETLAGLNGQTVDEIVSSVRDHTLSVEAAGAAMAAAIALAPAFRGQEIGARQALHLAGIEVGDQAGQRLPVLSPQHREAALALTQEVLQTLTEQSQGWKQRSVFERQWMMRDFRKHAGMSIERWLEILAQLEKTLKDSDSKTMTRLEVPVRRLGEYYQRMQDLARGYIKDPSQLEESLENIRRWQEATERLAALLPE